MISKTLLGVTAAAFLAAGSLAATTGTASATYYGDGYYSGGGHGHGYKKFHRKKICEPIFKKVAWQDRWGNWHKSVKIVDYKCWWKPKHRWHDDWNDGWY